MYGRTITSFLLLFFITVFPASAQSLSVFDIDASQYPVMRARYYAIDANGQPLRNLSEKDFIIKENGVEQEVLVTECPPVGTLNRLSSVLTVDVSGSMDLDSPKRIDIAKSAANAWIQALDLSRNECAITSFDDYSYLNQDFSQDKDQLLSTIGSLKPQGGTSYDAGFMHPPGAAITTAARGRYDRVVVFLTDGLASGNEAAILQMAKLNNVKLVFCITLKMSMPQILKNIARTTGGRWFENVETKQQIDAIYQRILLEAQGMPACEIAWKSTIDCRQGKDLSISVPSHAISFSSSYTAPASILPALSFSPSELSFGGVAPGSYREMTTLLTANAAPVSVNGLSPANARFSVQDWGGAPPPFILQPGTSRTVTIRFSPNDSDLTNGSFSLQSNACRNGGLSVSGGFVRYSFTNEKYELKLKSPNGGEKYPVGDTAIFSWGGIFKKDTVRLEYSFDAGQTWRVIADSLHDTTEFAWKAANTPSDICLARVSQIRDLRQTKDSTYTLRGHGGSIRFASYNPADSNIILTTATSESPDNTIATIWNLGTGDTIRTLRGHSAFIPVAFFSPDGTKVVSSGSGDNTVKIWNAATGALIRSIQHPSGVNWAAFSPDGSRIVSATNDKTARVWDVLSGTLVKELKFHDDLVLSAAYSPDGKKIATGGADNRAIVWDAATYDKIAVLTGHTAGINSVAFDRSSARLLSASWDGTARQWDVSAGTQEKIYNGNPVGAGNLLHAEFSSDGSRIATASNNSRIVVWSSATAQPEKVLSIRTGMVGSAYFGNGDGNVLAGCSYEGSILWNIASGSRVKGLSSWQKGPVAKARFSPDGTKAFTLGNDGSIAVWDAANGALLTKIPANAASSASFSPDGRRIISSGNGNMRIWDVSTGALVRELPLTGFAAAYSPDGTKILFLNAASNPALCDTGGTLIRSYRNYPSRLNYSSDLDINPAGTQMLAVFLGHVSGSDWARSCIAQYPLTSADTLRTLVHPAPSYSYWYLSASYSPDGRFIAAAYNENGKGALIRLYDTNGTLVRIFPYSASKVIQLDKPGFSADGKKMAITGYGGATKIFDVETGLLLRTIVHPTSSASAQISPDGTRLITASYDGSAKIWNIDDAVQPPQSDVSDSLWAIILPRLATRDVDFGKLLKGTQKDSVLSEYICNSGNGPALIKEVRIGGKDSANFALLGKLPLSIGRNSCIELSFRFMAKDTGLSIAPLTIITSHDTLRAELRGRGVEPRLTGSVVDFERVALASSRDSLVRIALKNYGSAPVNISSQLLRGRDSAAFMLLSGGAPFVLQPDSSRTLLLRFSPARLGKANAEIAFSYKESAEPAIVGLLGEGFGSPKMEFPKALAFANTVCGESRDSLVTIRNSGNMPVVLTEMSLAGSGLSDFATGAYSLPDTITEGASRGIRIIFNPASSGKKSAVLRLVFDSLSIEMALAGTRDSVGFGFSRDSIRFMNLKTNAGAESTLYLRNTGTLPLNWKFPLTAGSFRLERNSTSPVLPGDSAELRVRFTGGGPGRSFEEKFSLRDSCGSVHELVVSAEISEREPVIAVTGLDFGSFACERDVLDSAIIIRSSGIDTLTVTEIESDSKEFILFEKFVPVKIAPGDSLVIGLRFVPEGRGEKKGLLRIMSDAVNGEQVIELRGRRDFSDFSLSRDTIEIILPENTPAAESLLLTNTGSLPLRWDFPLRKGRFLLETVRPSVTLQNSSSEIFVSFVGGTADSIYEESFVFEDSICHVRRVLFIRAIPQPAEATLQAGSGECAIGAEIEIPILLNGEKNLALSNAERFITKLSFNSTVLAPRGISGGRILSDTLLDGLRVLELELPKQSERNAVLAGIRFFAALGNSDESLLRLSESRAVGGIVRITELPGRVALTGYCENGGRRLISSDGRVQLLEPSPNPAVEKILIRYEVVEEGESSMRIMDGLGTVVTEIFSGLLVPGSYEVEFNVRGLASGSYYILLRTPTRVLSKRMEVLR